MEPRALEEVEAALSTYTTATIRQEAAAVLAVGAAYSLVTDWTSPTQTLAAANSAVEATQAATRVAGGVAGQFINNVVSILTGRGGRPPRSSGRPRRDLFLPERSEYVRSTPPFDVYSRPVFVARDALDAGATEVEARELAAQQAETLAITDQILARRDAAIAELLREFEAEDALRYRRVIRPELSRTGTCGLCIAAATRVYTISDLMPIHSRCKCELMPIIGNADPAASINQIDLEQIYADLGETQRTRLSNTRYRVDATELGPTLSAA